MNCQPVKKGTLHHKTMMMEVNYFAVWHDAPRLRWAETSFIAVLALAFNLEAKITKLEEN